MARKKRVFISFDYADRGLKNDLVRQSEQRDIQVSFVDMSLVEAEPDHKWVAEANRRIQACNVFMVILGQNTHQAPGVLREVGIAAGLKKPRFQLQPKRRNWPPVEKAGEVVRWKWKRLEPWFTIDASRKDRRG